MARKAKVIKEEIKEAHAKDKVVVVDKEFVAELTPSVAKELTFWEKIKVKWEKFKGWFKYSETIFLARVYALFGAAVTTVAGFDWAPLWNLIGTGTGFTKQQLIGIGVSVIGSGILFEIARRRNAKDLG